MAVYAAHAAALRLLGAKVAPARERTFHGVPVALGAAVVLAPSFCPCLSELQPKLPSPAQISISERSTLLVDGAHIRIEQLELDGALSARPAPPLPAPPRPNPPQPAPTRPAPTRPPHPHPLRPNPTQANPPNPCPAQCACARASL